MSEMSKRLREIREYENLAPVVVEERTGISSARLLEFENGTEIPAKEDLTLLGECYGVRTSYLWQ